ncbi:methyltransferase domain-containing protein [Streptomyces sp. DH12]|uniref:class I SAM-dependent methyltransferase n=1 Tax=Streptomyces sp. DH12 TaxID=2857010 RepID=UPI001E3DB5C3|nr:methyltransferase domain-containing protein [Streptomyces sp. DH12]
MSARNIAQLGGLHTAQEAYRDAFGRFLAGTDEKDRTHLYLDRVVRALPARRVLLDIGAADGTTTRHLAPSFERTVCIEPSEPMRRVLARACPGARIVPEPVLEAEPDVAADLALLSHVLYYVPRAQWAAAVLRALGWLAPGGTLVVLMQQPDNACMTMVRHFTGSRFDLRELAEELAAGPDPVGDVRLDTVPACFRSADLEETVDVAGFHLSVPAGAPAGGTPARAEVREYVRSHFTDADGGYTIRHDQDALRLTRPGG